MRTARFDSRNVVLNNLKDVVKKVVDYAPVSEYRMEYRKLLIKSLKHVHTEKVAKRKLPTSLYHESKSNNFADVSESLYHVLFLDYVKTLFSEGNSNDFKVLGFIQEFFDETVQKSLNYKRYKFSTQIGKIRKRDPRVENLVYETVYVKNDGDTLDAIFLVGENGKIGLNVDAVSKLINNKTIIESYTFDKYIRRG